MFCSSEMRLLSEVEDKVEAIVLKRFPIPENFEFAGMDNSPHVRQSIWRDFLVERIIDHPSTQVFVSNHKGRTLRISKLAFSGSLPFWNPDENPNANFDLYVEGERRYSFVDRQFWVISIDNWRKRHAYLEGLEADTTEKELPPYEYSWRSENFEPQMNILCHIEGWSLCVDQTTFINTDNLVDELLSVGTQSEHTANQTKRREAALSFSRLFPNGKGSHSWKEVEAKISAEIGVLVSKDTILRGIGQRKG